METPKVLGKFIPGVGIIPANHKPLVITRDDIERMKYWKQQYDKAFSHASDYDLEEEYFESTDKNPDQKYMNKAYDGCPHCGSYEGDYHECPVCGHGQ